MTAEMAKKYRLRGRFITMIAISLTIILLFASLLILISTFIYTNDASDQLEVRFSEQISAIADTLSIQFENARSHGNILFNERSTILYFHPQYEITEAERSQLNQVMTEIARSENMLMPYIVSECIYFTDDSYVLTQGGSYDKDLYFSRIFRYEDYPLEFWNTLPSGIRQAFPATDAETTQASVSQVIPLVTTRRKDGSTLVHIANIDAKYIRAILSSGDLEFSYTLAGPDGIPIMASEDFCAGEADPALSCSVAIGDTGLTLSAYISTSSQYAVLSRLMLSNVIIIITLCSIGSLLVIILSRRLYSPIRTIKALIPETEDRRSEIEQIKAGVTTLVTRNDELTAQSISRQMLLYFSGISVSEEKISSDLRSLGIEGRLACIAILSLTETKGNSRAANAILNELQLQDHSVIVVNDSNLHEVIIPLGSGTKEMLALHIKKAMDAVSITALIGVSIIDSDSPQELRRAHKEAMQAIPMNTGQNRSEIRFYSDMDKQNRVSFSFYDQKGIANNFSSGNKSQLEDFVHSIIERNRARGINTSVICEILQQILSIGRNEMEKKGHTTEEVPLYQNFTRALSGSHENGQLELLVDQTVSLLCDMQSLAFPYENNSKNPRIAEIKTYINDNYMNPISLDIIADSLSMNPKYLSQLFKTETDENISDYISELRIEKAKELLIGTDLKIGQIAEAVGIPSRATFLRVFQKIENITPTEFRNIRKKEK